MREVSAEIALTIAWNRGRYLNNGHGGNHLPYVFIDYSSATLMDCFKSLVFLAAARAGLMRHSRGARHLTSCLRENVI